MSRIVVMGSGETAPTMVRVHREVVAATPPGPAVMLDTPFAFQMNRDELVARTRMYFADTVGHRIEVVHWPPLETGGSADEQALAVLDQATWAFAGPGSPTYALTHWRATSVPAVLAGVVRRGGTLVMGSAAALTLGALAVPVYEIYKVGAEPAWVDGLDLLRDLTGIAAAVIPHFDNREGGTHDTRYCYLGELRLVRLEDQLPDDVGVLGVDEHTAVVMDLGQRSARVVGNGVLTLRRRGEVRTVPAGASVSFDEIVALLRGEDTPAHHPVVVPEDDAGIVAVATSLRAEAERARQAFDAAIRDRDVDGAVTAVLELEEAVASWQADTLQSDDVAEARRVLRALVIRLGSLAEGGVRDPGEVLEPYVDLLLDLRRSARDARDFATSDRVRDQLTALGVEVRDTAEGTDWVLRSV